MVLAATEALPVVAIEVLAVVATEVPAVAAASHADLSVELTTSSKLVRQHYATALINIRKFAVANFLSIESQMMLCGNKFVSSNVCMPSVGFHALEFMHGWQRLI